MSGKIEMSIFRGDATEVRGVPALVIPANKQLSLGWGSHLAEKVRKLAGLEVEREALELRPGGVALGEVVITSAGKMTGFTHLIHAAVLDKWDLNPLFLLRLRERTSPATLAAATTKSLKAAAAAGLTGLVFTPMGAGIGGMRPAKCARIMVEESRRFSAGDHSSVKQIIFACLKPKEAEAFRDVLDS